MFHSKDKDTREAVGHIENVELTYVGQAFRYFTQTDIQSLLIRSRFKR